MRNRASIQRIRRTGFFWRLDRELIPDGITLSELLERLQAVELYRGRRWAFLHTRRPVERRFRKIGLLRSLGWSWKDFWREAPATVRNQVIRATVWREIEGRRRAITVPRAEVLGTDKVIRDKIPPFRYAGDPSSDREL